MRYGTGNWRYLVIALAVSALVSAEVSAQAQRRRTLPRTARAPASLLEQDTLVKCANLIYAGTKTSTCFSDKFLATTRRETNIESQRRFEQVKLSGDSLFDYPFSVMTGEGQFRLMERERINLKSYLTRGGFVLASAGCSSEEWDQSFRAEMKRIFPELKLVKIPKDHKIFGTVFDITQIKLKKSSGEGVLEGLEMDGRIVLIYSSEGLNDTANAGGGCCCCGGNEIKNSQEVNVNIFTYSVTH